jgi:hypothetical protein
LAPPFKPAGTTAQSPWGTPKADPKPLEDDIPF